MLFSERIALLVSADTGAAVQPLGQLEQQAGKTDTAFDKMGKTVGVTGETLRKGLAIGAGALAGGGILAYLTSVTGKYVEAANAANLLAQATNASITDASKFATLASQFGLDVNDLTEIFSDFQQSAAGSTEELAKYGVEIVKTRNGTTDWIATSVNFLEAIQGVGDATERNRLLFKYFGEEGAKQLMALVNSGVPLKQALAEIQGLTEADVKAAQEYAQAQRELHQTSSDLGNTLGAALVPALTTVLGLITPLVDVIASLDGSTLLLGGSTLLLAANAGRVTAGLVAAGGAMRAMGNAVIKPLTADFTGLTLAASGSAKALDANTAAATRSRGAAGAVGALTKGLLAVTVAWEVLSRATDAYSSKLDEVAAGTSEITRQTAVELQEQLSLWEKFGAAVGDLFDWRAWLNTFTFGLAGDDPTESLQRDLEASAQAQAESAAKAAQAEQARKDALTGLAKLQQEATDAQKALNDAIADGATSNIGLAGATADAATAIHRQELVTDAAERAMKEYADTHWDAVDAFLSSEEAARNSRAAYRDFHDELDEFNAAVADGTLKGRDYRQAVDDLTQAALDSAEAYALSKTGATDTAEAHDAMIERLEKLRDALPKGSALREPLDDLIDGINEAQVIAGEGIEIDGIRWKDGTTKEQIDKLKGEIGQAWSSGQNSLAAALQADLDALEVPELPPQPVIISGIAGPDGKPITAPEVNINVTTTGVDTARASIDGLGKDAVHRVEYNTVVTNDQNTRNVLTGLAEPKIRRVEYNTDVTNDDNTRNVLRGLADPDVHRIEYNTVVTNEQNTRNVLDGLDRDRTVYYDVVVRGANTARSTLSSIDQRIPWPAPAPTLTPKAPATQVTLNYHAGVIGDPETDGRIIKRILETQDTRQGRTPGQPLAVAW